MSKFFTAGTTTLGFYVTRTALESIEITDELWLELLAALFAEQQIIAGTDGMPIAADFPSVPEPTTPPAE